MVKQWRIRIPKARSGKTSQQKLNERTPDYVDLTDPPELPDISLPDTEIKTPSINNVPGAFKKLPNFDMRKSVSVDRWVYIQHRMEHEGRAIALAQHLRRGLSQVDGDTWTFIDYDPSVQNNNPTIKTYTVDWDGLGDPLVVMGVEESSANPGGTNQQSSNPLSSSTFGQYAPDAYVWAVYFLVNGAPSDDEWLPNAIPTIDVGPAWPDYDLSFV